MVSTLLWVLFLCVLYHSFCHKMFLNSILKFFSSLYLFFTHQLNVTYLNCGFPYFRLLPFAYLLTLTSSGSATSVMALNVVLPMVA